MSRGLTATKSARAARSAGDANVLGQSLRIRGRVIGEGDVRIEGEVEGDVKISGAFELAHGGAVTGNVTARTVTVDGALTGDVEADGPVVIRSGARVSGNMSGTEIALEEGAAFSGRIEAEFELPADLGGAGGRRGK